MLGWKIVFRYNPFMQVSPSDALVHRQFAMSFVAHQDAVVAQYQVVRMLFEASILLGVVAVS